MRLDRPVEEQLVIACRNPSDNRDKGSRVCPTLRRLEMKSYQKYNPIY